MVSSHWMIVNILAIQVDFIDLMLNGLKKNQTGNVTKTTHEDVKKPVLMRIINGLKSDV